MKTNCPKCFIYPSKFRKRTRIKFGSYFRKSDRALITRYKCRICGVTFSTATYDPCYRQLKRQLNDSVYNLLSSGVTQRRMAYLLKTNRKTIKRKFIFLGQKSKLNLWIHNRQFPISKNIEIDELETFEITKFKPLSVALAVESKTRRILGFQVSQMPPKGKLAAKGFMKYGKRQDHRRRGLQSLLLNLKDIVSANAEIKSDSNPNYPTIIGSKFPAAHHIKILSRKGSIGGQGELKKVKFDPIFSLNHTCAKMRADVARLIRKTWSTTKKRERLELHMYIMADYHNRQLISKKRV